MAWSTLTSRSAGDAILASDQNITADNFTELAPFFSGWTSWTPTVSQSGARSITNTSSRYLKVGKLVIGYSAVTITNAGTAGTILVMSLPVTPQSSASVPIGPFWYVKSSTGVRYVGTAWWDSSGYVQFQTNGAVNTTLGQDPSVAVGNNDLLRLQFTYEVA